MFTIFNLRWPRAFSKQVNEIYNLVTGYVESVFNIGNVVVQHKNQGHWPKKSGRSTEKLGRWTFFLGGSTNFKVRSTSFYVVEPTSKPGGRGVKRNGGSIISDALLYQDDDVFIYELYIWVICVMWGVRRCENSTKYLGQIYIFLYVKFMIK